MKIANSNIQMYSNHYSESYNKHKESLTMWKDGVGTNSISIESENKTKKLSMVVDSRRIQQPNNLNNVKISDQGIQKSKNIKGIKNFENNGMDNKQRIALEILNALHKKLTGKELKIFDPSKIVDEEKVKDIDVPVSVNNEPIDVENDSGNRYGWGMVYEYQNEHYEEELTSFNATGIINTEDGKSIEFDVSLNMSRSFYSNESLIIEAGDKLKDPLVINFDGSSVGLTDTSFNFDIDSDGLIDQISFVDSNSGFLAYDKNDDGVINNGLELFGTESGNGFKDLLSYDDDKNYWIDENDSIYDKLRIWSKDENGGDQLIGLGKAGIGAIYLGNTSTEFSIKDSENELQGQVRSSGIYLYENGTTGTIQQIDLTTKNPLDIKV